MGEKTAYYIPENQSELLGKVEEIADRFWDLGVFLATPDEHIYERLREYKEKGKPIPEWKHNFSFAEMGLADEGGEVPVPSNVYDATCPKCGAEVYEEFTDALSNEEKNTELPNREVICSSCHHKFKASETKSNDTGLVFTRLYLWVSDIYDEDWDPEFRGTVESIMGKCKEIVAWDT